MPFKASWAILSELFSNKDPKLPKMLLVQWALACEQALRARHLWWRGGKGKESLQLCLWKLNICIAKVDAKSWLVKMTLVMTSLPLARVFQCLLSFALVSTPCWLAEIWQLSWRGATGEVEFKFQRCSRRLSFLFLPPCQNALESLLTGCTST